MPSLDASFSVEGSSVRQAHSVAYGQTVDLVLLSASGAHTIQWSIDSTSHPDMVAPTITVGGSPSGATASFPMVADPLDGEGRSVVVKCLLTDSRGNTATDRRVVGVENNRGIVPLCVDEELDRHATHGWGPTINTALMAPVTLGVASELTLASDAITITGSIHSVDTQADGATDDLATINGGLPNQLLVLYPASSARTVVAKDGTGNLKLAGDFTMDNAEDRLTLISDSAGTTWYELSRSDNGA